MTFILFFVFQDIYQSSEIMSIKVGNNTKRAVFYGGEKNMTRDEDMTIQVCIINLKIGLQNSGHLNSRFVCASYLDFRQKMLAKSFLVHF